MLCLSSRHYFPLDARSGFSFSSPSYIHIVSGIYIYIFMFAIAITSL